MTPTSSTTQARLWLSVDEDTDTIQTAFTHSIAALTNIENLLTRETSKALETARPMSLPAAVATIRWMAALGGGNDTFIVDNTLDAVTAGSGTDTIQSSITWDMTSARHNNAYVENLILTRNTLDNIITGNSAVNTLTGGGEWGW